MSEGLFINHHSKLTVSTYKRGKRPKKFTNEFPIGLTHMSHTMTSQRMSIMAPDESWKDGTTEGIEK